MAVADSEEPKSVSASVVRSNDSNIRKSLLLLRLHSLRRRKSTLYAWPSSAFIFVFKGSEIQQPWKQEQKTVGEVEDHREIETESGSRFLVDEQRRYPSPKKSP